jgi:zinc protease
VGQKHDDTFALSFLGQVLTSSRTARLTKALVYDRQSAATVSAGNSGRELAGDFGITITPRPGHSLAELEATTDSIIARLKAEGPTEDEMAKARAGIEFGFIGGLESNLGKAETLLSGQVFFGDPGYFRTQYTKLKAVSAADVKRVANKYLGPNRVLLSVVPLGKLDQASRPEASVKVTVSPDGGHYIMGSK